MATDYDAIAATYDQRYALHAYGGIEVALDAFATSKRRVVEVGCGTGKWLARLPGAVGIDRSAGMLAKNEPGKVALADAQALPLASASFDGVVFINALHHVPDQARALREAARVLRPGGELLVIGLQPRAPGTEWYVYEYFPGTQERDLARYASREQLASWIHDAHLQLATTFVAHRFDQSVDPREAISKGMVAKHTTSQLAELGDDAYTSGLHAISAATAPLRARIELHATLARR